MASFNVRLDDGQRRQLKAAAAYLNVSMAEMVRSAVTEHLAHLCRAYPRVKAAVMNATDQSAS